MCDCEQDVLNSNTWQIIHTLTSNLTGKIVNFDLITIRAYFSFLWLLGRQIIVRATVIHSHFSQKGFLVTTLSLSLSCVFLCRFKEFIGVSKVSLRVLRVVVCCIFYLIILVLTKNLLSRDILLSLQNKTEYRLPDTLIDIEYTLSTLKQSIFLALLLEP